MTSAVILFFLISTAGCSGALKTRVREARTRALHMVNTQLIEPYWQRRQDDEARTMRRCPSRLGETTAPLTHRGPVPSIQRK